jgi:hypothetical protein
LQASLDKKLVRFPISAKRWTWWYTPVIPATLEVVVQASPDINTRPNLKKNYSKKKNNGRWLDV